MAYARGKYFAIGRVGNGCYGKYVGYLLMVMQETILKDLEFLQGFTIQVKIFYFLKKPTFRCFPQKWKQTRLILPDKGKNSPNDPRNTSWYAYYI